MTCKKKKKKDNGRYTDTLITETKLAEEGELKLYTAEYKINILKEAESLRHPGELGELLRREGLFSSHLATWYWQRERGELGHKEKQEESIKDTVAKRIDALEKEFYWETEKIKGCLEKRIEKLERKNKELKIELEKANFIIETQKKIIAKLRAYEKYR